MRNWNIGGIIATLIIVLSLPLYALKEKNRQTTPEKIQTAKFVTSEACLKCHKKEYEIKHKNNI